MELSFSFIVPVYNRPQEIRELLDSFSVLEYDTPYEIVIVEDGSTETAKDVVEAYSSLHNISYYYKENSGPGDSRNYGMERAKGNYFIILDSDVLLPAHYLETVSAFLQKEFYHCYGGSDAAHMSFNPIQKAINYTMTSFITTGGIRGNKIQLSKFEPRSFNMGISREAFRHTRGFSKIHPGEDPDLSHRIRKAGFETTYIPNAFVYHKRKISWSKFYQQVKKFGLVRPILSKWHPESARITFWFPTVFVAFVLASIIMSAIVNWFFIIPLLAYLVTVFIDASYKNKSLKIGILVIGALFVQFFGYGLAFLKSTFFIRVLNKPPEKQFPQLFFK